MYIVKAPSCQKILLNHNLYLGASSNHFSGSFICQSWISRCFSSYSRGYNKFNNFIIFLSIL